MAGNSLWVEVIARRRTLHQQAGDDSCELWAPADPAWMGLLEDMSDDVIGARAKASSQVDPRAALIDLLAVASAWVDAFDQRQPVT
jgi:hypothetical protein